MARTVELLRDYGLSGDGTLKIVTLQEAAFISGEAFTHSDYDLGVLTSNVTNYLLDPTACTCSQIIAEVPIFNATAGPVTIEFFSDPTVTANGTALAVFNRRATSTTLPEAKLYVGPTITDDGTRFSGILLTATDAVQGDTGDVTFPGLPFEVDKTKLILIRVTNTDGTNNIGRRFDWVEI